MQSLNRIVVAAAFAAMLVSGLAAAASPKDFVMPYLANTAGTTEKGLVLVRANDFVQRTFVPASTVVFDPHIYRTGTPQNDTLVDFRPHTLIYGQGGKWRRASLRSGLQPSSAQVSSENQVAKRCTFSSLISLDFKVVNAAMLLYQLPGPDGKCKTADDIFRTVRITDAASKAPVKVKTQTLLLTPIYSAPGKLLAHLGVQRNKTLTHFNPALTTTKPVLVSVTKFEPAGQASGAVVVANVNGNLRRIQSNGTLDASPLRTPAAGFDITQANVSNDLVYWVEQSKPDPLNPLAPKSSRIFRVPVAGGTPVQMVSTNSAVTLQGFTTSKLLYSEGGGFSGTGFLPVLLKSIGRTAAAGAATATLHSETQAISIAVFSTLGDRVFFNVSAISAGGLTQVARTVRDNASSPATQGNGSSWIGFQREATPVTGTENTNLVGLLLARNGLESSARGSTLFAVNPVSLASSALPGAALAQNTTPFLGFALGAAGLGTVTVENQSAGNTDVFAFDLVGKRYKRLTNNTPTDESALLF
ncbi:MAG: hypothetical protein ACT4PZ_11180 [Panacagrimonas sp.]